MSAIWAPDNRYQIWFEIEAAALEAMAQAGTVPQAAVAAMRAKGKFESARIDEIERETKARRHRLPDQRRRACRARGAVLSIRA